MSAEPVEFLTAALARAEETAKAATPGPWRAHRYDWDGDGFEASIGHDSEADVIGHGYEGGGVVEWADARFIEAFSPDVVLRLVAGARQLLADLQAERHLVVDGDCWFTCRAATEERDGGESCDEDRRGGPCDCGRDARVEHRVWLLAQAWGWEEAS